MVIYVGAQPGGRPAPDLFSIPPTGLVLAFANDAGDGNFQPQWDPAITPEVTAQLQQQGIFCSASLGGDQNYGPWVPPSDPAAWVSNATSSLAQLMDTYSLMGLDIDYEGGPQGLEDSFVECMSQVIINLSSPGRTAFTTLAPFGATAGPYSALYNQCGTFITTINYQAYADGITDVQGYLNLYANLAQQYPNGYQGLGLGIASSQAAPRGLQPPDIYTVWQNLLAQGVTQFAVWCAEDSVLWDPPFAIESTLIQMEGG
jgi:chitinase